MMAFSNEDLQSRLAITEEALRLSEERGAAGQLALELMHEVKNPLETLGHLTYLAQSESDPEQVKTYLRLADEQMKTLGQIASHTLGFARARSAPQRLSVTALTEAAIRIHQRAIDQKKIHLVRKPSEDHEVMMYPGQMLQVLSNLIANALDALVEDEHLHLNIRRRAGRIEIIVADNGTGIAQEHLERVFEPFFSTKDTRGTGLGLSLSKKIIERHQGTIRMRSSCGPRRTGTIFRISLPA
jgi:signal transduction histidine kinase